jgi:hypothetical protein
MVLHFFMGHIRFVCSAKVTRVDTMTIDETAAHSIDKKFSNSTLRNFSHQQHNAKEN